MIGHGGLGINYVIWVGHKFPIAIDIVLLDYRKLKVVLKCFACLTFISSRSETILNKKKVSQPFFSVYWYKKRTILSRLLLGPAATSVDLKKSTTIATREINFSLCQLKR